MTSRFVPTRTPSNPVTAADIMARHKGIGPGFDVVRLTLSCGVFFVHCFVVTLGPAYDDAMWSWAPARPFLLSLLPMFFALSGFLVAGSAIRTRSAPQFLWFRVLRIAPALVMEVSLSAIILGPSLTNVSLADYFSDPLFYKYFLNIIGEVQLHLPGTFIGNPTSGVVNQNLWTLRPEFYCYLLMLGLIVSRLVLSRFAYTVFFAFVSLAYIAFLATRHWGYRDHGPLQFHVLVYCFMVGIFAYHWVEKIVIKKSALLIAVTTLITCLYFRPALVVAVIAMTYIVIFFGMQDNLRSNFLKSRDYSYGIYLFGFPIQQTVVWFLPIELRLWWIILILALPLTIAFSAFSWHWVEKPMLSLKRLLAQPRRESLTVHFSGLDTLKGVRP